MATLTTRVNLLEVQVAALSAQLAQLRAAPAPKQEKKPFLSMSSWVPLFKQAHPSHEGCIPAAKLGEFICQQRALGISP